MQQLFCQGMCTDLYQSHSQWSNYSNTDIPSIIHWIWVSSRKCSCLVTWFCCHLIAKSGNKTAAPSWSDPYDVDGLVQDYSNSIANTLELLQFCTTPSISCNSCSAIACEQIRINLIANDQITAIGIFHQYIIEYHGLSQDCRISIANTLE